MTSGVDWTDLRDIASVFGIVGMPLVILVISLFHKNNVDRFKRLEEKLDHQVACLDDVKNRVSDAAKRSELDAAVASVRAEATARVAANMQTVSSIMATNAGTVADRMTTLDRRVSELDSWAREHKQG